MDPFDLNLRHLKMFLAVAEAGSISAGARLARVSQPALSQAIRKLEETFGTDLLERTAHGAALTGDGRRVARRVKRAMTGLDRTMRNLGSAVEGQDPTLILSTAHVRGLFMIAEQGSFAAAARAAGVAVPSLHRAVRDLEALTHINLLERRGRGVGLTKAGRAMTRGFTIALSELRAAFEECRRSTGQLTIGAMALSRSLLLPATLARLMQERPESRADVIEGSYLELVELLRSGRIDILIGALRERTVSDLNQKPLFVDRLTIIGRKQHPLAGRIANFEDLADYPWIVARRASALLDRWQKLFDRAGKTRPDAPIQCSSVALIRGMLIRSDFLTLLSPNQVSAEISTGSLVEIKSDVPDTMRTIGAITRKDWYPTDLQTAFMDILQNVASEAFSP